MIRPKWRISHAQGYLSLGMVAEAAAELDRIPAPERDGLEVLGLRVAVLQEQQDWPALAAAAGEFVRRAPDQAAGWVTWAYGTRRAYSIAAAEKILFDAERHHPKEPTIQFNLGCYACLRGDLEEAKRRIDRAVAVDLKFAEAALSDPDLALLRAEGPDCQSGT